MTHSPWGDADRRPMRVAILVWVVAELAVLGSQLVAAKTGTALANPLAPPWLLALAHPAFVVGAFLVALVSALRYARRDSPTLAGALLFVTAFTLHEVLAAQVGPGRWFFSSGLALGGWLIGAAFGAAEGSTDRRRHDWWSEQASVALLGTVYLSPLVAELLRTRVAWAEDATIRNAILRHMAVVDGEFLLPATRAIVETAWAPRALAMATLLVQGAALAWVFARSLRPHLGVLLLAFHVGTTLLLNITYAGMVFYVALFSFPWPRIVRGWRGAPAAAAEPMNAASAPASAWARVALALVLAIGFVWALPLEVYTQHHGHAERANQSAP